MKCETKTCNKTPQGKRTLCQSCYRELIFIPLHPLYDILTGMKQRCYYPKNRDFADYGGRGITVCDRWLKDYYAFESDMGMRPSPNHQIDRIDNDGNYEPGNCRWVLASENTAYGRRRVAKNSLSGVSGVTWDKKIERWIAGITVSKKHIYLGCYVSKNSAIRARKSAEEKFIGMI